MMTSKADEINSINLFWKLHHLEEDTMIAQYIFSLNATGQQLPVMSFLDLYAYVQHHVLQILHCCHDFLYLVHILYGNIHSLLDKVDYCCQSLSPAVICRLVTPDAPAFLVLHILPASLGNSTAGGLRILFFRSLKPLWGLPWVL